MMKTQTQNDSIFCLRISNESANRKKFKNVQEVHTLRFQSHVQLAIRRTHNVLNKFRMNLKCKNFSHEYPVHRRNQLHGSCILFK